MPSAEASSTRRRFLNWFFSTSAGALFVAIVYPILRFVQPPDVPEATTHQVEAGSPDDPELLAKGYKIVRFGEDPVILVRLSETDYRAFSAMCTHLACIVEYQREHRRIWCNCHNGEYDLNGRNVAGPPPRPLERFEVNLVAHGPGRQSTLVVSKT